MGRTVTSVGTSVARVIEDSALPDSVRNGVIRALFQGGDFTDYIREDLTSSIGVRADRFYTYAENNYHYGLPSGEIFSSTQGRQQVEATIETLEAQQVLIKYSHYGPANALHIGWVKLVASYGYNQTTNQLAYFTAQKGVPVYLKDMVIVVPASEINSIKPGVLSQWGTAPVAGYTPNRPQSGEAFQSIVKHSMVVADPDATGVYVRATIAWQPGGSNYGLVLEDEFAISINEYSEIANFFHAKYEVGGVTKYWMYQEGTGTYPALDAIFGQGLVESGSYYPFIHFRSNKQSLIATPSNPGYVTGKRALKKLGVDYDTIADAIDENPDIGDVEQAFLTFAVPPVSTDKIENRYLFDYFDNLYFAIGDETPWRPLVPDANMFTQHTIVIQDAIFKMALGLDRITKRIVVANIGAVGSYSSAKRTENAPVQFTGYAETQSGLGTLQTITVTEIIPVPVFTYRKQITPGLCEEIEVTNLSMVYWVYGEYATTSRNNENILLIPIDKSLLGGYSIKDKETLFSRSLHMVFNSRVVTKLAWYETSVFRLVLVVVAVVVTIASYGADGGSAIASALGLSGLPGLVATIVVNMAVGRLLVEGFALIADKLGVNFVIALSVLAIAVGAYQIFEAGGLAGTWAESLLQISNGLRAGAIKVEYEDLLQESNELAIYAEQQTKLLNAGNELLETSQVLSPYVIFGEKPEDFYNRTVHFGNIGTLGIAAISSYVDLALTLPKLSDTLGDELNGL